MSIHTALREFTEKYDAEAITSIDRLPAKVGMRADMIPFKLFNLTETCKAFCDYLVGYRDYMKAHKDNPRKSTRDIMKANTARFLKDPQFFKECDSNYKAIPEFVKSYLESVQKIAQVVESVKEDMELNDIELEYVGDVTEYADTFIQKLNEKFDPIMSDILWASGYAGAHKKTPFNEQSPAHKVTFL